MADGGNRCWRPIKLAAAHRKAGPDIQKNHRKAGQLQNHRKAELLAPILLKLNVEVEIPRCLDLQPFAE